MSFGLRRLSLIAIILASLVVYGYFEKPGHQSPTSKSYSATTAISGSMSIQGPYFSDRDRIAERIIAAINHTRSTLDIAVYSITQSDVAAAIAGAHRRGVRVRIVSDEGQSLDSHSEVYYLRSSGIPIRLSGGFRGQRSLMHNKFAIFDGSLVETGSFNWTTSANSYNFENAIFIADREVATRYEREFDHIWEQAR